jgi:hypothetical protein
LLCLIPIVMIVVRVIVHFAQFAIVLENMSVMDSLRRGWAILKANFANALILGIIQFVIGVVVVIAIAIPIGVAFVPFIFGVLQTQAPDRAFDPTWLVIAGLCFVCYLPVLIVAAGIYRTWDAAVWTLAYRDFAGNTPAPALPVAPAAPAAPFTSEPPPVAPVGPSTDTPNLPS